MTPDFFSQDPEVKEIQLESCLSIEAAKRVLQERRELRLSHKWKILQDIEDSSDNDQIIIKEPERELNWLQKLAKKVFKI